MRKNILVVLDVRNNKILIMGLGKRIGDMAQRTKIESDNTIPKPRKRRKPMSDEQKAAAAERLAIAREKRLKENPPEYKSVHPDVLARPDTDPWNHKNVKKWIKTQRELLATERKNVRQNVKGAIAKMKSHEGYVSNMERYLKTGIWLDLFWGEYQEKRCRSVCHVMAYHPDGTPKRTVGTWYPDIGCEWTKELEND
jgi:hypothetical protein